MEPKVELISINVTPDQLRFLSHQNEILNIVETILMALTMSAPLCKIAEVAQKTEELLIKLKAKS